MNRFDIATCNGAKPISDAELTRIINKRIRDAANTLYQGTSPELKAIAIKEAMAYIREVLEEIINDFRE